tara:strand:+ start:2706 stop:4367 length:1662 start_codon:yes stop_codon:yes gene_type:complete
MCIRLLSLLIPGAVVLGGSLAASSSIPRDISIDEPRIVKGELVFPEGANIPRYMTETERRWMAAHPETRGLPSTAAPDGPIVCGSEYEPMDGIVFAWEGFTGTIAQMAAAITTTGDANVYVACDSNSEANSARSSMISAGADPDRIVTVVRSTDTVWIRDYGPRMVRVGGCRAIVDHNYNRPRPNDDDFNLEFADFMDFDYYRLPLTHGGGNYHASDAGDAAATRLINNENPGYSEAEIRQIWQDYQNVDTELHAPFPTSVDSTQHIDMWMQIIGEDEIIIADWPSHSGSTQDVICDDTADYYESIGWTVYRTNSYTSGWTHYTYTNMVLCNDLVILPRYNDLASSWNNNALNAVQNAMPEKTVIQVTADSLAYSAGVFHCITMHIPANAGGADPTAYLRTPNGGGVYDPGDLVVIEWLSDDDEPAGARTVDISMSADGGATFEILVSGTADDGSWFWSVPDVDSDAVMIKIEVVDADGNRGADLSDGLFSIEGTSLPGDVSNDGFVGVDDLLIVIADWSCGGIFCAGDVNGDLVVNVNDLLLVINYWGTGTP